MSTPKQENTAVQPQEDAPSQATTQGFAVSYGFIAIASGILVMGAWVLVTLGLQALDPKDHHETIYTPRPPAPPPLSAAPTPMLAAAHTLSKAGASQRSLRLFYKRRAYSGAPPRIPHDILEYKGHMDACLSCHAKGGYVPKYDAFAPVTPHPTLSNCVQCHVPQKTKAVFQPTAWKKPSRPKLRRSALAGSPPPIPHDLQMRTQCNACHAGPSAVKEIRVPHPERSNCLQCHVPRKQIAPFRSLYSLHKRLEKQGTTKPTSPR